MKTRIHTILAFPKTSERGRQYLLSEVETRGEGLTFEEKLQDFVDRKHPDGAFGINVIESGDTEPGWWDE